MTTELQRGRQIAAALAERVGGDATATAVADAVTATLLEIEAAIAPFVGTRGLAALFKRSLFLTVGGCPGLLGESAHLPEVVDPAALRLLLSRQDAATAIAGGGLFLQTFQELLASLIGMSLTERLLRAAWIPFTSHPPGQNTLP